MIVFKNKVLIDSYQAYRGKRKSIEMIQRVMSEQFIITSSNSIIKIMDCWNEG